MAKIKSSGRKNFAQNSRPTLDPELLALMQLVETEKYEEVASAARRILGRRSGQPLAMKALSFALVQMSNFEEALPILRHLVRLNAHDPEIQNNFGIALCELMYWEESLGAFEKAMQGLPKDPEIAKHMGDALFRMHRWNDAVPFFLKAIELHEEDYVEAVQSLASCLLNAQRIDEAWVCYKELHDSDPDNGALLFQFLQVSLRRCYWVGLLEGLSKLRKVYQDFATCGDSPFGVSALPGVKQTELLSVSIMHAKAMVSKSVLETENTLVLSSRNGRTIRIGYLSGDFRRHPVGFCIPEIIELHNRASFEIFAYSTQGTDVEDPIRGRLEKAFDHFHDVTQLSVRDLRTQIRKDDIDILVDLAGWTAHGRPEALALRCAPIQVNWLGYPGTMGHPALADYIIGDPIVTPLENAPYFSETIAQLPHCYLPADTTRKIGEKPSRASQGLPEDRFVFCSLNNSYKYNPEVFDLWCEILVGAPDSVLWLSHHGDIACDHLYAEVERRGVSRERLFFARRVPDADEHLARLGLADLALDPFPYNSHSTGIDTLWAGVPMITMPGEIFASRVGASLLTAAEVSELIVKDVGAYRNLALDLYRDRDRLLALRSRLLAKHNAPPLFDMPQFVASLEASFLHMIEDTEQGVRRPITAV